MTYPRLDKALQEAARLHANVERDGNYPLPYSTHPIEVVMLLRHVGEVTDEEMLCAAALHDTVEERATSLESIEREYGPRVRDLVEGMTREEPAPDKTAGLTKDAVWALRSNMLLHEIGAMSHDVQAIKLADRLSNVRSAHIAKQGKKLKRYLGQTAEILRIVPRNVNPGLWDAIQRELR